MLRISDYILTIVVYLIFIVYFCRYKTIKHNDSMNQMDFIKAGLIDVQSVCSDIKVHLKYATKENFLGYPIYAGIDKAYTLPVIANALAKANSVLKRIDSELSILVWDAARPLSVQKIFYEKVQGTPFCNYIAEPINQNGFAGFHNYGMAVDATIVDSNNLPIDMGTDFDSFTPLAHTGNEVEFLAQGLISDDVYRNRMLLYYVMSTGNLFPHPLEWWHFQLHHLDCDKSKFKLLDF